VSIRSTFSAVNGMPVAAACPWSDLTVMPSAFTSTTSPNSSSNRPGWEERSPGQPDATLARIRKHITPKLGDIAVERLCPLDLDNLYGAWRADGMAEATVRRMHAILHAALTQAVRWDLITSNPADRIEPPRPRKSRRKAPPDDVLVAILAAAGDDMICYLRLAAVTGARRGEMVEGCEASAVASYYPASIAACPGGGLRRLDSDEHAQQRLLQREGPPARGGVVVRDGGKQVELAVAAALTEDPMTVSPPCPRLANEEPATWTSMCAVGRR
jgi:hypothetical protein